MTKREAVTPKDVIASLLRAAGPTLILIGGQALAFWMERYGVAMPDRLPYVSRDIDFLSRSAADVDEVERLAAVLDGQALIPPKRSLTALVGQAVRDVDGDEFINVDVVFRVLGANSEALRSRSVEVGYDDFAFRIMHPIDVLKSRLDNLYRLAEKQNEIGTGQLRAAILVVQAFEKETAKTQSSKTEPESVGRKHRSASLKRAALIERMALGDAGRKVVRRFGLHVADAIEPNAVSNARFHEKKLPELLLLMSETRREELEAKAKK